MIIIIYIYGGYPKLWYPKTALTPRFREPFRALSRPSRIGTWDYDQVFVCIFVTKIYRRIVFKNIAYWRSVFKAALVTFLLCVMRLFQSTESMALGKSVFLHVRTFDFWTSGHWFCTRSLKSFWYCDVAERTSPFWARVGSGRIRLSQTFRRPFQDLSWTFRGFLVKKMKFQIMKCHDECTFMKILWSSPVVKYSVTYRCHIQSQTWILWQFCVENC